MNGTTIGKLLIYTFVLSLGAFIFYNYYKNNVADGGSGGGISAIFQQKPKDIQVNYIPKDFSYEMDEETTLAVLTNPQRYRREFNDMIYDLNLSILGHVANRMGLPDSLMVEIEPRYKEHHDYLKQLYYNDFLALRDSSSNFYEAWYENEYSSAATVLNEVASKYTCFLVNHVIMSMVKNDGGKIKVVGKKVETPCAIAMTEALRPVVARLQERAAIDDFAKSKGLLEEKVESTISELATVEIRDKKGLSKQMQTKIWGIAVSSTDVEISAISILKAGFKLDDYFKVDLNSRNKLVTVTMADPVILSHEVYPKVDKLEIGWMRELNNEDFNKNFNILRSEFRREANESGIMEKAKTQANEIMKMIFSPVLSQLGKGYKLKIRFKTVAQNLNEEFANPVNT
ncbi:MAG: DUF4230 domain-containing protein [Saprospiraceae bacterium]